MLLMSSPISFYPRERIIDSISTFEMIVWGLIPLTITKCFYGYIDIRKGVGDGGEDGGQTSLLHPL